MNARVFAPAKINLTLEVGPARADGRHPLQSVVLFADIGDWVEAAPAGEVSLQLAGPFADALAREPDNLVMRAAQALRAHAPGRGAALTLTKNLPVASGIGGGSADAAAALKALRGLWGLKLDDQALARIGAALGADVPVCVGSRTAYMTGAGETFAPMSAPAAPAVLVNPLRPLSTSAVYREFDRRGPGGRFAPAPAPDWRSLDDLAAGVGRIGNHLLPAARALEPAIETIAAAFSAAPGVRAHGLSGSGATLFAVMESAAAAAALAEGMSAAHPDWWVRAVTLGAA